MKGKFDWQRSLYKQTYMMSSVRQRIYSLSRDQLPMGDSTSLSATTTRVYIPPLKFLVDRHELRVLVRLHGVPRSRVLVGPYN